MGLRFPLPGGYVSQHFGHSAMAIQPTMCRFGDLKAWWQYVPGGTWDNDVHAGTDFAGKPAGTALEAMEAGTCVRSTYDGVNGGGHVVEIEIKPGVRYSYNHCNSRLVGVGAKVTRGQRIATVGATGTILQPNGTYVRSTFGVHLHCVLTINERGSDGVARPMLYNPYLFLDGQKLAGDSRVKPIAPTYRLVLLKYPVNVRTTPDLDVGATNIAYTTRADGIYNWQTGAKVANLTTGFQLRRELSNDDGTWGELLGFNRVLYVAKGLYYFK